MIMEVSIVVDISAGVVVIMEVSIVVDFQQELFIVDVSVV